jgi:hypothetical protein
VTYAVTGYAIVLWAAAAVSGLTAAAAWKRRRTTPGGIHFTAMMACVVAWCLTAGMEAAAVEIPAKMLFSRLGYLGICGVAPLFLRFSIAYGGSDRSLNLARHFFLWVVPAITLVLVFTNGAHHLVWTSFTSHASPAGLVLLYGHGPWYRVWVGYYAAVTVAGIFMLFRPAIQGRRIFVGQTIVFLAGAALPWIGEALYLSRANPFPGLDFATVGFAVMGALLLVGMSRFSLFTIVPVARGVLVERMSEGLIVLDPLDKVVDINPAAHGLLRVHGSVIGRPGEEAFTPLLHLLPRADAGDGEMQAGVSLPGSPPMCLDVVIMPLRNRRGIRTGRMIMIRDVTLRQLEAEERDRLLDELRTARADLKTLRGLLPICSSCKKIRDGSGCWQTLEDYLQAHSEARFSHGLCDDCIDTLYPELSLRAKN